MWVSEWEVGGIVKGAPLVPSPKSHWACTLPGPDREIDVSNVTVRVPSGLQSPTSMLMSRLSGHGSTSRRRGDTRSMCSVSTSLSAPAAVYTATTSSSTSLSMMTNPLRRSAASPVRSRMSGQSISSASSGPSRVEANSDTGPGRWRGKAIANFFLIRCACWLDCVR